MLIKDKEKISLSKKIGEKKKLFDKKFILPVNGRISGVFGSQRILNSKPRRPHYGIDIAQKKGAPVIAPSSGKVKLVDYGMFFTGNTIVVDHGLGLMSIFAHLEDIFVEEGQKILANSGLPIIRAKTLMEAAERSVQAWHSFSVGETK